MDMTVRNAFCQPNSHHYLSRAVYSSWMILPHACHSNGHDGASSRIKHLVAWRLVAKDGKKK